MSKWSTIRPRSRLCRSAQRNTAIKVYAKLPGWFTVSTPLGGYNPDWAVLVEKEGGRASVFRRRDQEWAFCRRLARQGGAKIQCGKAHFRAVRVSESPAEYVVPNSVADILNR